MKSIRAGSALASQWLAAAAPRPALTAAFLARPARQPSPPLQQQQRRTFLPNPFAPSVQSLTASRTLPYSSTLLYDIISDVNSYHTFVPFCQESTVTKYSNPDANGKTWPEEGKLVVGFNSDISEAFYSRIHCIPGSVVEAISGTTDTTLPSDKIAHHNPRPAPSQDPSRNATVLTQLLTRWTLRPLPSKQGSTSSSSPSSSNPLEAGVPQPVQEQTEVSLAIDFAFANPVYAALSAAAAPKVAEKMIQAFETRVKQVVDGRA